MAATSLNLIDKRFKCQVLLLGSFVMGISQISNNYLLNDACRMICRSLGRGLPLTLPNIRQVNGRDQHLRPRSRSWCLARSASCESL